MGLVYDDDEGSTVKMRAQIARRPIPYDDLPATTYYLKHYGNLLYLDFIAKNPRSTRQEQAQARSELVICQRKLDHWKRHPNWSQAAADAGITKLKREWGIT